MSRPGTETVTRRRDSAASRQRLLHAAGELFAEHGYDRTTSRDIGRLAGVDPTMIARYFGGKAQLYVAALRAETPEIPADLIEPDRLTALLNESTRPSSGPIYQAAVRPHDDPAGQAASRAELHRWLVEPLRRRLTADGLDQPGLRAELTVAAFVGVVLARTSGAFDLLPEADNGQLQELLLEMMTPRSPSSQHPRKELTPT